MRAPHGSPLFSLGQDLVHERRQDQAVANGNVIQLPSLTGPLDTPAPDSIIGIIWMANQLYPGELDLDCEALATEFYARFYEYDLTAEEASSLCS